MSELQGNPPKVKEAVVLCSCRKGTRVATELETPGHENKVTCLSNCTTAIGITVKYVAETRNPAKPVLFFAADPHILLHPDKYRVQRL